jgi:hypothetical protein
MGTKVQLAVDTMDQIMALQMTPAITHDRGKDRPLVEAVQDGTYSPVALVHFDQVYRRRRRPRHRGARGQADEAKLGFVRLRRRWAVERSIACKTRFRSLVREYECLPEPFIGLLLVAFG